MNGERSTASLLNKIINSAKAGDKISLTLFINNETKEVEIVLGKKSEKGFKITPAGNPSPLQKQILEDWLKG